MFKKTMISFVAVGISSVSLLANAGMLVITNNTNQDSTTKTNGSPKCSSQIPFINGVTKAHTSNTLSDTMLRLACVGNLENCTAVVYNDDHCGGAPIAVVTFSVTTGLKSSTIYDHAYTLAGGGFNLIINGGH